jgi:hypothetical protein
MSFEIGDEVFGTDPEQRETFGQMCRVLRAGGGTVDLIVYDPETRMWEDRDMSIAGVLATSFSIAHSKNDYDPLEEGVSDVLNNKDPFAAIEVLMCRHRLQARMYPNEKAVADCTFISREELIRQSAECLVRLAAASMAPYNEEVVMSKKKGQSDPEKKDDAPNKDAADVGPHHGAQQSGGNAKEDEVRQHELLPENFRNRTLDWCHGFVDRRLAGNVKGGSDAVLAKITDATPDYIDGWNKATNYIRSGGK